MPASEQARLALEKTRLSFEKRWGLDGVMLMVWALYGFEYGQGSHVMTPRPVRTLLTFSVVSTELVSE